MLTVYLAKVGCWTYSVFILLSYFCREIWCHYYRNMMSLTEGQQAKCGIICGALINYLHIFWCSLHWLLGHFIIKVNTPAHAFFTDMKKWHGLLVCYYFSTFFRLVFLDIFPWALLAMGPCAVVAHIWKYYIIYLVFCTFSHGIFLELVRVQICGMCFENNQRKQVGLWGWIDRTTPCQPTVPM
jgi:hypothetical protein